MVSPRPVAGRVARAPVPHKALYRTVAYRTRPQAAGRPATFPRQNTCRGKTGDININIFPQAAIGPSHKATTAEEGGPDIFLLLKRLDGYPGRGRRGHPQQHKFT